MTIFLLDPELVEIDHCSADKTIRGSMCCTRTLCGTRLQCTPSYSRYLPNLLQVVLLAIVQGLAELLPISSSAHVIVIEKLMGLNPSSPTLTLLLVMLHTGTMFAVIVYFWKRWRAAYFESGESLKRTVLLLVLATAITGIIGEALTKIIERFAFPNAPHTEVEQLFNHLELIAPALAAVGILILCTGLYERKRPRRSAGPMQPKQAGWIGAVQGLCLPFRGFSRSGATISTGIITGVPKGQAEDFSFALAVILTPAVIAREAIRLWHSVGAESLRSALLPSVLGSIFAFLAGLAALRWLSRWLEVGRWYFFGVYCLLAAAVVAALKAAGY
jgi:undecaprenyl-diphosphatase